MKNVVLKFAVGCRQRAEERFNLIRFVGATPDIDEQEMARLCIWGDGVSPGFKRKTEVRL